MQRSDPSLPVFPRALTSKQLHLTRRGDNCSIHRSSERVLSCALSGTTKVVRKKDSVALFEVISKIRSGSGGANMSVPGWMINPKGREGSIPEEVPVPKPKPAAKRAPPQEAIISTDKGRLRVSLNYVSCMVVAAGLVVLLLAAFWLGRATGGTAQGPQKAGIGDTSGEGASRVGAVKEESELPRRIAGRYYMVIQDLKGNDRATREEAHRIAKFCVDNGEPVTVNINEEGSIVVWSLKPFRKDDTEGTRNYAGLVEELGKRYFREYHTYDFRQPRQIGGGISPVMLPYVKTGQ